jgi:phosphoribosylformylglycinamidine cyclo-ligase
MRALKPGQYPRRSASCQSGGSGAFLEGYELHKVGEGEALRILSSILSGLLLYLTGQTSANRHAATSGPATTNFISMSQSPQSPLSYKDAGVDIDAGDALVERIKPLAKKTMREGVLAGIGGFGALFEVPKRYKEPVLVSGTDGVGTKLRLAFEWQMHDTVGIDLVAMSVNDVLVQGAEPLFFLDYFACGKLDIDTAAAVVGGIARGCELSGCALIGGETAEMPGMYPDGEYDLAGFAVGAVEKSKILTGQNIAAGDVVLGLASSGVHSNGFSLVRKCIERAGDELPANLDGKPFKEAVMEPTRLYVKNVLAALAAHPIKALAHITGGGLLENIPRVLPDGMAAHLRKGSWPKTELFAWLQNTAAISDFEMNRTFNNGIGMVVVVDAANAAATAQMLREAGEKVFEIGVIAARGEGAAVVVS